MPDDTNGERKTFNRRARTGWAALALITVAFYVCIFKGVDIRWFTQYSIMVLSIAVGVILGISVTDSIAAWRDK